MVLLGEEHSYFFFGIYLSHTSEIFMFSVKRKKKNLNFCLETVCKNRFLFLRIGNTFPTELVCSITF